MRRATGAVVFAKRQRLNLLRTANGPLARQLLGELMMSPEPLQRHELVDATLWVSQYGHVDLARQALRAAAAVALARAEAAPQFEPPTPFDAAAAAYADAVREALSRAAT